MLLNSQKTSDIFFSSCKSNCESKLLPSDRLVLDAVCTSCRRQVDLEYKWAAFERTSALKPVTDLQAYALGGLDQDSLVIEGNFFTPGKIYVVRLTASKPGGNPGKFDRDFTAYLNTPPSSGSCFVQPSFGYARVTYFQILCQGWSDPDSPLSYRFTYRSGRGAALISSGRSDSGRFMIPTATKGVNSSVEITALIEDSYGAGTEEVVYVTVSTSDFLRCAHLVVVVVVVFFSFGGHLAKFAHNATSGRQDLPLRLCISDINKLTMVFHGLDSYLPRFTSSHGQECFDSRGAAE